ncbi:hypothetical protein EMIHUDRAFT_203121 [Emiliania huxleyi CCMP1516]|uniref:Uncharacterized protein n=2 Tax=Emiliania huxleyi TaxID=2903 RepID=A0A0D3K5K8_EMIH1|nr:hypothetical protein EMIHUDRAFT_203121 [Emiliania huxleyi CCMP1516]EOD31043.1 hypothetical protein EMIHUDRAFT_203121 [Emiliania huxleyi CCMP1516]|eukprot:XP_005783472.1 hypothetical protein EMIHUDRAFT_203121 [Emiliania huxleyi CCMP1516]
MRDLVVALPVTDFPDYQRKLSLTGISDPVGQFHILRGSRNVVLYLAKARATPAVAKSFKEGWWAIERIFYGFFQHSKFTALAVPKADGFNGSHDVHMFAGDCKDAAAARKDGLLTTRGIPCACPPCIALLWGDCEMVAVFGRVKKQKAPRAAGETAELRQMESLEVWAASLKAKQLSAVRADRREQSLEGLYWLAVLKGKAYTLAEDTVVNTDTIPAGYLVVKAQWLRLEQRECEGKLRCSRPRRSSSWVNHMVRLAGLRFSPGPGGPSDRQLRSAREKLYYIGLQTHYSLEACCSEDQSY